MPVSAILAAVTAGLVAADADPNADATGLGPLRIGSQSPGQSLHLGLIPHAPAEGAPHTWEFAASSTWVNVWANASRYQLDYEEDTTEAMAAYVLDRDWRIEGGVEMRITFGGLMDGSIQEFHHIFGINQEGRDKVPHGRTIVHIDPTATQPGLDLGEAELERNRTTYGRLSVRRSLLRGENGWPALELSANVHAPLADYRQYRGGIFDVGLDLAAAEHAGDFRFYQTLAWIRFGAGEVYGIALHRSNWSGFMAIEYRWTRRFSLLFQYLLSEGVSPDYRVFSNASHEIAFGIKAVIARDLELDLAMIENLFIFDNSPDFGLHLGLSLRL